MVFSSHLFVYYFLPLSLLLYFAAPRRARNFVLVSVTFVFYGWANPAFTLLLAFSMLVDYFCGLALVGGWRRPWRGELPRLTPGGPRSRFQKAVLTTSIVSNLLLLAFFKYWNFGVDSWNAAVGALGLERLELHTLLRVVLPLGISFYTFQAMSYSIDVYRGEARPLRHVVDFFCFEAMYPQLVAGPIVRFAEIADQLRNRTHTLEKFARGFAFFGLGMAKKVLLANPCGKIADTVFDAGSAHALDAWLGAAAYAFQIYFDFSGYSDMAVGLGLMLGFVFAKNFDAPYTSESITEFWRRWHISLSTWLRDNLYLPLGGNRRGPARTYFNLFVVMVLGGLWHGAAWNFVIWGAFHGVWLMLERALGRDTFYRRLPRAGRVAMTFLIVLVSWVFFRASDLPSAARYLGNMVGWGEPQAGAVLVDGILRQPYYVLCLVLAAFLTWGGRDVWEWTRVLGWRKALACMALFWAALVAMATQGYNPFIYFIF